jgi:glucoamylase
MTDMPAQGVVGNSQILATIGKRGELRYLFWPTIDYPQHVVGSLPGLFYDGKNGNRFAWLTDPPWNSEQQYVEDTNILQTVFKNSEGGLTVTATDFVLPDVNVLIRHLLFRNLNPSDAFLRAFYYNDLAISESEIDDTAYYLAKCDAVIHYKRDFYFLYGGTMKSSGHQCGVHDEDSDAFKDVYDARLSGDSLVLYDGTRGVNSCLSWDLGTLHGNQSKGLTVLIALGSSEDDVAKLLEETNKSGFDLLFETTSNFWRKWISTFKHEFRDEKLSRMTKRSLLVLKLLTDKNHGGIVAAPCMEPEYRFCWPRDATYVAYALDRCGFREESERFYEWCKRAQEREGGLYQRYYIEARIRGPCWRSQIDEIATVIWGMGAHFDLTGDDAFADSMWPTIKRAAQFIRAELDSETNLVESVGLWEERFGSHTYSNAALISALRTCARFAKLRGETDLHRTWTSTAETMTASLLKLCWDRQMNRFIKTFHPKDENVDVSLLALSYPFEVLPADDERMRKTAISIEQAFNYSVGGIGRYPSDTYYDGNPWILATLWLALYYEKLKDVNKAGQLIKWAIDHATDLDLLSEQVNRTTGSPISALPLAWSHAFFLLAVLGLDELKATTSR